MANSAEVQVGEDPLKEGDDGWEECEVVLKSIESSLSALTAEQVVVIGPVNHIVLLWLNPEMTLGDQVCRKDRETVHRRSEELLL